MSGYHEDAMKGTIPAIAKEIEDLFNGYDEQDEKLEAMKELRKRLQKIYLGWMKLEHNVSNS